MNKLCILVLLNPLNTLVLLSIVRQVRSPRSTRVQEYKDAGLLTFANKDLNETEKNTMTELISEQDILDAFQEAGLDLSSPEESTALKQAIMTGLQRALAERNQKPQPVETVEQFRARLMEEAAKVGNDKSATEMLKIAFSKPPQAKDPEQSPDISNMTNPADLLKIGLNRKDKK